MYMPEPRTDALIDEKQKVCDTIVSSLAGDALSVSAAARSRCEVAV